MGTTDQTTITLYYALFLHLTGLFVAVWRDSLIRRDHRRTLLTVTILVFFRLLLNSNHFILGRYYLSDFLLTLFSVYGYTVGPIIIVLFIRIMSDDKKPWILAAVNTAVYSTTFFSHFTFAYSNGMFVRGPLGYSSHIFSLLLLIWSAIAAIRRFFQRQWTDAVIPIVMVSLLAFSAFIDTWVIQYYEISLLDISIVGVISFCYMWLHFQFQREYEQTEKERQRMKIVVSQIQPHFLFNALSAIQALCHFEPKQAADAVERLGHYLRHNLDFLNQPDLISFEKELEHTKIYADIERLRFPSIRMKFDVEDANFEIPPLTVQPMVENAIRHGIRSQKHGAVAVTVRTRPDCHMITIRDNGKGFDVEAVEKLGKDHIGIRNVRDRIETLCGGTVELNSRIGKGTTITIRLPR